MKVLSSKAYRLTCDRSGTKMLSMYNHTPISSKRDVAGVLSRKLRRLIYGKQDKTAWLSWKMIRLVRMKNRMSCLARITAADMIIT